MRVYLPATTPLLHAWVAAGEAPAGTGYAVTPHLREWYREGDQEEMEYVAQLAAARASLDLLAREAQAARRRVVLAVDAPDADVVPTGSAARAEVAVGAPLPFRLWASVLADGAEAESVVAVAVEALPAAALGDDDAAFALDEAASVELGWWAVQELDALLDGE